VTSNGNAGTDKSLGGNPDVILDDNGVGLKVKGLAPPVVGPGAEKGALGDADMRAERDLCEAKYENFLSDPDVVSGGKSPRERDVDAGTNDDAGPELCPKYPEQGCA